MTLLLSAMSVLLVGLLASTVSNILLPLDRVSDYESDTSLADTRADLPGGFHQDG